MPAKLSDETRISFRSENPKRSGTKAHERYEQYKTATTVAEAIRLGASRGDVSNDVKQGFCTLVDGAAAQPPASAAGEKRGASADAVAEPPAKRPARDEVVKPAEVVAPAAPAAPAEAPKAPEPPPEAPAQVEAAPSQPASSSSSSTAKPMQEVDLSFAKLDGKPLKFVKRAMGEAKRLLCAKGLEEAEKSGYSFCLKDQENLAKWMVQLRDLNPDGKLMAGLKRHRLDPCIDLELILPDGFPLEPPFARVLYPQLSGGYVFERGGICFEPLTPKGWVPSMTLPALAIAIKGILDYGEVQVSGVGNRETRTVPHYTEAGARKDAKHITDAHRGGEGNTYGSLKMYKS
eukprot:gb/GFBE01003165.1/.p1 GENE.gb/GFBE01003165.1/~~gb/GFBE01003165.1/.p1  ORF type:complete len:347 (+),score=81.16 gb/GFBE01003165.1/:1-1041(+)